MAWCQPSAWSARAAVLPTCAGPVPGRVGPVTLRGGLAEKETDAAREVEAAVVGLWSYATR